jgi:hypothetical protein
MKALEMLNMAYQLGFISEKGSLKRADPFPNNRHKIYSVILVWKGIRFHKGYLEFRRRIFVG